MKSIVVIWMLVSGLMMTPLQSSAVNADKTGKVMVDLSPNQPVHKLFPLTIISIDGEPVAHKDHFIMLDVGEYTLKFTANINFKFLPGNDRVLKTRINQRKYSDTLLLKVEAKNKYQLAFDARPTKVEDWRPIVLSVSEAE